MLLAKGTEIAKYLTAVVAAAAALDSVFRFNRKARTHETLCRRFTDLSSKIAGWEPTPANLRKARVERLRIERDEPPVRRLVDLQAYNEELRALGKPETVLVPLTWWQRTVGYVFTPGMAKIEKWKADREIEALGEGAAGQKGYCRASFTVIIAMISVATTWAGLVGRFDAVPFIGPETIMFPRFAVVSFGACVAFSAVVAYQAYTSKECLIIEPTVASRLMSATITALARIPKKLASNHKTRSPRPF